MFDGLREHCGVVGVFGHPEAATIAYLALQALQHRGQESAGVVASDGAGPLRRHRGLGLVADVFSPEALAGLTGDRAIGHVRYATAGGSGIENAQPLWSGTGDDELSVAHNGNLLGSESLRASLEADGAVFSSSADTEALLHLVARTPLGPVEERIAAALEQARGAYSLAFLSRDRLVVARDPLGFRPLMLGRLKGGGWIVASETCAFSLVEAETVREVAPGEVLVIDQRGPRTVRLTPADRAGRCVFELIYFSRPDSEVFGRSVYESRLALGRRLAQVRPAEVDVVVPVPDSGNPGALGYAQGLGKPFELGLLRSHYVGRTFIEPMQSIRHFGVRLKLSVVAPVVRGRRVAVVDDSLVRGTTARKIVKLLRDAGAAEVHLRITAPPTRFPCFYGIDTPTRSELLASTHSEDEIARYVTADSVGYLERDELHEGLNGGPGEFCDACFSGQYPLPFEETLVSLGRGAA